MRQNNKTGKIIFLTLFAFFIEILFFRNILGNDNLIGSNGDARYIDLILEHYYQFLKGNENFTDLRCFYPVTNSISYSDMLLALAIPFCILRFFGISMFMANKIGLILIHAVGTASTIYLLNKKMKLSVFATAAGTIIFCYANSLSVKSWHNQMLTVCLVPLIFILMWTFFQNVKKNKLKRILSGFGAITILALIFYTSFYNAYYFLIYSFFFAVVYAAVLTVKKIPLFKPIVRFVRSNIAESIAYIVYGIAIMIPFVLIYLPTLRSGGGWDWDPVLSMLPTWRDFFNVSSFNIIYGSFMEGPFFSIEGFYAGELKTGFPLVSFAIFVTASFYLYFKYAKKNYLKNSSKKKGKNIPENSINSKAYIELMYFSAVAAVFCCFIIIIKIHGYSIWYLIYKYVPGASAIRAVSRFNMFLTLPVGIISAVFADMVIPMIKLPKVKKAALLTGICCWLIAENTLSVGVRSLWCISDAMKITNETTAPPADCDTMFITDSGEEKAFGSDKEYQLTAWEIAYKYDLNCINGHSGKFPPDWSYKMSPYHNEEDYNRSIDEWIRKYDLKNVWSYDINTNTWTEYTNAAK